MEQGVVIEEPGANGPLPSASASAAPLQGGPRRAEPVAGQLLGQYFLLHELGRGGFGCVFKAQHRVMDRIVALKIIAPEMIEDQLACSLFRREVLMATQLCHPNIVMAYDANDADGLLYLVMEYVDGSNLEQHVEEQGALPLNLACEMLRQAGLALQYAHERGMVHRDIKPANLLIPSSAGLNSVGNRAPADHASVVVKIADFGLARLHNMTRLNTILSKCEKGFLGTPHFVSPEQARNPRAADTRSDLYSLGCTFYYALTAQRPFDGESALETVVKHLEEEPEPLEALRPDVPAGLAAIIRRLMAKRPEERFQTPAELVAALSLSSDPSAVRAVPTSKPVNTLALRSPVPALDPQEGLRAAPILPEPAPWIEEPTPAEEATDALPPPTETGHSTTAEAPSPLAKPSQVEAPDKEDKPAEPAALPAISEDTLHQLWQQWTAAVAAIVGGEDPRRLDEVAYGQLHDHLLNACRSRARAVAPPRQGLYRRLETLVEPWLNSQALALTDRATLVSLLHHCRQLEQELFIPKRSSSFGLWAVLLAALVTTVGIGAYLGRLRSAASSAKSFLLWETVTGTPLLWTGMGFLVVILLSILLHARATRRRS